MAQHENVCRVETKHRYASIYAAEEVPVIRAFMLDERKAEGTIKEIRQRSPSNVSFAESNIRPDLQWHYLREIPPHSMVSVEARDGVVKSISATGPCDTSKIKVLAIHAVFSSSDPVKCRLRSIALFDGSRMRTIAGSERDDATRPAGGAGRVGPGRAGAL